MNRVLPSDLECERSILGAVLLSGGKALPDAAAQLTPADFYHPGHAALYEAMLSLDGKSTPVDCLTLSEELRATGQLATLGELASPDQLNGLTASVVSLASLRYHVGIVKLKAERRRWTMALHQLSEDGFADTDDGEYLEAAEAKLLELTLARRGSREPVHVRDALRTFMQIVDERFTRKSLMGIPSGFAAFDASTSGFQRSNLVVIAARPSMGKTAFAGNIAVNSGAAVLFFSLEMSKESLVERMVASEGRIDSTRLKTGQLKQAEWLGATKATSKMCDVPVWLNDAGGITLTELRSEARRWRQRTAKDHPDAMVIVDYLQLIRCPQKSRSSNREQEISEISRGLKALAKDLKCPVIALSQLNRGVENRGDKRPTMADLRESGAIEQDADLIAFIYRDEVYNPESEHKGIAEIIISKQRCGPTGIIRLRWQPEYTRFSSLECA